MNREQIEAALARLRQAVEQEAKLPRVFEQFLELVEQPGFVALGEPFDGALLLPILEAVAPRLGDADDEGITELRVVRLEPQGFTHGGFHVGARLGSFFLFDEPRRGMVALHGDGAEMRYARVTLTEEHDDGAPN